MSRSESRMVCAFFCLALLSSLGASPIAAQFDGEDRLPIELDEEGDALVSVTFASDLNGTEEVAVFKELRENATARTAMAERFENRMAAVAADASSATDRQMSVRNADVDLRRDDDAEIVGVSIEWSNLAVTDDDRLTVTEPFDSEFEPAQTFTVAVSEGYAIASATPEPERDEGTSVAWGDGAVLEDFEVLFQEEPESTGEDEDEAND